MLKRLKPQLVAVTDAAETATDVVTDAAETATGAVTDAAETATGAVTDTAEKAVGGVTGIPNIAAIKDQVTELKTGATETLDAVKQADFTTAKEKFSTGTSRPGINLGEV